MTEDTKDIQLRRELALLGEEPADDSELVAAERLAARMEGALHVVDAEGDEAAGLAELLAAAGLGSRGASGKGEEATLRALDSIFSKEEGDTPDVSDGADELERRRAHLLAQGVDGLIAGLATPPLTSDQEDLLHVTALIRASVHCAHLSPARLESLVESAFGAKTTSSPPVRRAWMGRVAMAAVLALLLLGSGLLVGSQLQVRTREARPGPIPTRLTSRSTRDILPGAFPRSQTAAERIDIIYHDRLRSFRELSLGGASAPAPGRQP